MCENAYLSIKNPKASRALKRALDPGRRMLASLARLRFAMSATFGLRSWGPPLDQILDPHLAANELTGHSEVPWMAHFGGATRMTNLLTNVMTSRKFQLWKIRGSLNAARSGKLVKMVSDKRPAAMNLDAETNEYLSPWYSVFWSSSHLRASVWIKGSLSLILLLV